MKKTMQSMMAAGLLLGAGALYADGAALYTAKLCHTCHGADAKTPVMATYPKLAGQNAAYAAQQVKDIRDGKRTNGMTMAMKPMVASLTDAEIQQIADWLATQ
jgi:cytochrome c